MNPVDYSKLELVGSVLIPLLSLRPLLHDFKLQIADFQIADQIRTFEALRRLQFAI